MNGITIGCLIAVMFTLAGCGARDVSNNDIKATKTVGEIRTACYAAVSVQSAADAAMVKSVRVEDRTMMTMVYLNGKQTTELVAAATGHSTDRCAGTNLWDFMIAETEAKNQALSKGLGHATTMVKWAAGAWAATDIISHVGATNTVDGQFNSLGVTSQTESGNTATRNDDSFNTATDTFEQAGGNVGN